MGAVRTERFDAREIRALVDQLKGRHERHVRGEDSAPRCVCGRVLTYTFIGDEDADCFDCEDCRFIVARIR